MPLSGLLRRLFAGCVLAGLAGGAAAWNPCPLPPERWSVKHEQGLDTEVCIYRRTPKGGRFVIDLREQGRSADRSGTPGTIAGRPVTWIRTRSDAFPLAYHAIARMPRKPDDCDPNPTFPLGVWTGATSRAELNELRSTLAALELRWEPLPPIERYHLAELQLIATGPSVQEGTRWAIFRDPAGALHRVRGADRVGRNHGLLGDVEDSRVVIRQLCRDELGDWIERPVEKAK